MKPRPATIMALLPHARDLVGAGDLDPATVLKLLDHLPAEDLDISVRAAIKHARLMVETSAMSDGHMAAARYALARVIVMLECHVAFALPYRC